jgi:hypothetical protein
MIMIFMLNSFIFSDGCKNNNMMMRLVNKLDAEMLQHTL